MMFRVVRFAPDTMLRTMASATGFLKFSALAFVTLSVALVLLSIFYRLIESDLGLDGFRKEAVIAVIASTVQGAGFWFSASLLPGDPFRNLLLPGTDHCDHLLPHSPQRLERAGDRRHPLLSIDHNRNGIFFGRWSVQAGDYYRRRVYWRSCRDRQHS